jgi:predicted transposase YbfD/YdcC
MSKSGLVLTDAAEAAVVDRIQVRLVRPEEEAEWNRLMAEHHYLKSARMVGEQLRYVAEAQGQWMALLGWSAAAYHLKGREGWIGWEQNQRRARLHLVANNARFCRLGAAGQYPNLASRALALNLERLSADWRAQYGHPIVLVESFVDLEWFRGTAYKASGWQAVGCTAGFKRVAADFYEAHDRPKQLFVRELVKHAARGLRGRRLPAGWGAEERVIERRCPLDEEGLRSLWMVLHHLVPESRDVHGLRHREATVLAITFAYLLSGGQGGYRGVALFAQDLSPTQRADLRCWFNRRTRRYDVPTEDCVYRVLKAVPVLALQAALWAWQKARHGGADGGVVVLDGKALRGSGKTQLVGAINAASGRTLGVEAVADKSNEIPAGQRLLDRLDLEGTIALMDALHTQVETARSVVQEGGGDFVWFVKGNQEGLQKQARHFLPEDFSPSTTHGGTKSRADGMARHRRPASDASPNGLSARGASRALGPDS